MRRKAPIHPSVALASLAAGPIFLISTALAVLYLELPRPIDVAVNPAQLVLLMPMFLTAVAGGFILSILPNLFGSSLLHLIGGTFPAARALWVWTGTGALFGAAIVAATAGFAEPAFAFGIIATSACCAAICRYSVSWG